MKELPRLEAAYAVIDGFLENQRMVTQDAALQHVLDTQILNDQAYFLLCWGQLQLEIDGRCRNAIRRRRNVADWQIRRSWDLYNPEDHRLSGLSFEDRSKLVLDPREGRGSAYAMTVLHYGIRNRIAHGKLESTRIDVLAFIGDCYIIQTALHRAN